MRRAALCLVAGLLVGVARVASAQFAALEADPKSEAAWAEVFEARTHFDGAAHEEYAYACHYFFVKHPDLLHSRFLGGDSRAVVLLQDVFVPGTWVLDSDPEGGDDAETSRILGRLQAFVSALAALKPPRYEYDNLAMHEAFIERARTLLQEWPEKRRELLKLR